MSGRQAVWEEYYVFGHEIDLGDGYVVVVGYDWSMDGVDPAPIVAKLAEIADKVERALTETSG